MIKKVNGNIRNNKFERQFNIDLLRIICCIAVIIIHISADYINNVDLYKEGIFFSNLLNCITRFAVPCFVMIAGGFALENRKKETSIQFYKKKIYYIIVPTLLFSIFYFLSHFIKQIMGYCINNTKINLTSVFIDLITGNLGYHMWYLYMMIFIYIITPVLWKIKEKVGNNKFNKYGILLLIIAIPFSLTSTHKFSYDIGFSIYYIGYYILGYTIKESIIKKSNLKFSIYLIIGLIILFINSLLRLYLVNNTVMIDDTMIVDNFWILIAIASIFIYKAFVYLDFKIDLTIISKYTLYIYLIHVFVIEILKNLLNNYETTITPYISIPLLTVGVFLVSLLLSKIYLIIYKKIDKEEFIENKVYGLIKKVW